MISASVIVPARDAQNTLPRTLTALADQEIDGDYEVIVVDDGSRDRTAEVAGNALEPVKLLRQPALGPGAARNLGVRHARGGVLAFCDADVYPTPGWLAAGISALESADIVQGMVVPDPEDRLGPFDRSLWITYEVGLFETANLFTTRAVFEAAGGFEDWLMPRRGKALAEDVLFGYRARRRGAVSSFCPQALAHHAIFPRTWIEYVLERGRLSYLPAMTNKVPELRREFLYRHAFLSRRTSCFDLALAGLGIAIRRSSPLMLACGLPYLRELRRHSMRARPAHPPRALLVGAADLLADLVGLGALVAGSVRYGSLVA